MNEKADVIQRVCAALATSDVGSAATIARDHYPFIPLARPKRRYSEYQSLRVFMRDGFVDLYSGTRLVFPGTLRLLSHLLPTEFPAHPNWKMAESHLVYWELFPTIDHKKPLARGGQDDESNWVTTSMLRNSAKSNWTLEELGWSLHDAGDLREWDGLTRWFLDLTAQHPDWLSTDYFRRWHRAATRVLRSGELADSPQPYRTTST